MHFNCNVWWCLSFLENFSCANQINFEWHHHHHHHHHQQQKQVEHKKQGKGAHDMSQPSSKHYICIHPSIHSFCSATWTISLHWWWFESLFSTSFPSSTTFIHAKRMSKEKIQLYHILEAEKRKDTMNMIFERTNNQKEDEQRAS